MGDKDKTGKVINAFIKTKPKMNIIIHKKKDQEIYLYGIINLFFISFFFIVFWCNLIEGQFVLVSLVRNKSNPVS